MTLIRYAEVVPKHSKNLNVVIGKKLRYFRKSKGLSQEEFAEICGFHRTYIGAIERGERNITIQTLQVLADALNVETIELLRP